MAIKSHQGPTGGWAVMQQALTARGAQARVFATPLGGAVLKAGSPIPVYHLPVKRLLETDPLAAAEVAGWRYPVLGGAQAGFADIREGEDGSASGFGGLSHGLFAQRLVDAANLADRRLAAIPEDLEPRLLDVPGIQFAALWLHGSATDYFISLFEGRPLGTAPLALVTDIIGTLKSRLASRMNQTPRGGQKGTPTN